MTGWTDKNNRKTGKKEKKLKKVRK